MKIQYQKNNITVFESALYRTTCTVIGLKNSVVIVDPNWLPNEVAFILQYVEDNYKYHYQYLLFTHSDYDHIIGYGKFPSARVIASKKFKTNPNKAKILQQIIDFDHEYYIQRDYNISYPSVDIIIKDQGQIYKIDDIAFVFYHAPGHVADGLFIIIPELKCWIAGDYLSNIEIPFVDDNLEEYIKTLHLSSDLVSKYSEISLMINGHGDIAQSNVEIKKRIQNDLKYLELINPKTSRDFDIKYIHQFILTYAENPNLLKAHQTNISKIKMADNT